MNRNSLRRTALPAIAAVAVGLSLTACGAANEDDSDADNSSGVSGTLNAGGASSQEKAQGAWVKGAQTANSGLTVNYEPVGSGDGRKNFISGGYSVAGSDAQLKDDELAQATDRCDAAPLELLAYVGPVAISYNVPGLDSLTLTAEQLTAIFSGQTKNWSEVGGPDLAISPVHRSDASGTQNTFTKYLVSQGAWPFEAGDVWPAELSGEGADGTSGVAAALKAGAGTIGFLDRSAALANDLPQAEISGEPIELRSWLIACPTYSDADEAARVKAYLSYVFSADGQEAAAAEAGTQPLEGSALSEAAALVDAIS